MPDRTKLVATMMTLSCQIAASDAFARDALAYAGIAWDLGEHDTASALREMVVARRVDVMVMRGAITSLAGVLARMPVEA